MQFINSSLEKLAKNISENGSENLMLLKQKDAYPYEYMEDFLKIMYLIKNVFAGL